MSDEDDKLRIGNLGDLPLYKPSDIDYINSLFYGDTGVGKTTLGASAANVPGHSPLLLIDVERGSHPAKNFPGIEVVRPQAFADLSKIYSALAAQLKSEGGLKYKTIMLDSITEMQRWGTESVMARGVEQDADKDPDKPEWSDWNKSHNLFRRMIRAFANLPCNTIFIALEQTDLSRPSRPKAKPMLNGKMADEFAAVPDIVLYLYKKEDNENQTIHRCALSAGTNEIVAKDRSGRLPEVLIDPTYRDIHSHVFSELTETKETEDD